MKCDECGGNVKEEDCEFASLKSVIDGKEYSFCCHSCIKSFEEKK